MIYINQGNPIPSDTQDVSGLIFLGSTHSVVVGYAWIEEEITLIPQAV